VEDVCVHKKAPWLFDKLREKLKTRVGARVRELKSSYENSVGMDPVAFLCAFDTAWRDHCDAVDTTRRVFLYLDRMRVAGGVNDEFRARAANQARSVHDALFAEPRSIWDVGVRLFRDALVGDNDEETTAKRTRLRRRDWLARRRRRLAPSPTRNTETLGDERATTGGDSVSRGGVSQKTGFGVGSKSFDAARLASQGALLLIAKERSGESKDSRGLLRRATRAFAALGVYAATFEPMFLEQTASFYAREGDDLSVALTPFEYGAHCETRLREELNLCDDALDASTKKTCARVVAKHLVEKHLQRMLDEGFTKAFKENRVGDIARFFQLAKRCGGGTGGGGHETLTKTTKDQREALASTSTDASNSSTKFVDAVRRAFGVSLRSLGTEIVKDEQREKDMVMRLLTLKSLADDAVHRAFESGETFVATNREAFEHFVNQRGNKPPELIAKFVDSKLRASSAKAAGTSENDSSAFVAIDHDAETEKALDGALSLFRHVQGKDAFEAFYKRDLAKRLLLGKSASVDAEKSFIGKLKAECGAQFTAKLEGMFKDVDASRDLMRAYNESLIGGSKTKRDDDDEDAQGTTAPVKDDGDVRERVNRGFVAHVHRADVAFTACARTRSRRVRVVLPRQALGTKTGLARFGLGHCVLRARFDKGEKELCTSTFQAAVLLLFNDVESLTAKAIVEKTGMDDGECRRTLQSLACGKTRVLTKTPKGREIEDDDVFTVNGSFTEKLFRVKVNSIQMKETEKETDETNERVFQDRQYQIDACLVRIMKTRRTTTHASLVAETFAQISFPAKPADVKKRIESLIEREYLERDRNDPQTYNYLA
jgi:cullin-4